MPVIAFTDVAVGSAFAFEIDWLAGTGITQGRGDGTYGLGDPVTRGAMAAFLYRLAGSPPGPFTPAGFTDVPAASTFESEIDWLAGTGITQGRGDGTYGLGDPVTRGAMAAFLYRLAGSPPGPFTPAGFTDVPAGSTFASEIDWLAGTGITQGRGDGTYGIGDPVTRGAMAAFLYRLAGSPPGPFTPAGFTDVPAGSTFESEIHWLAGTGITQGRGDGTYGLGDPVTRGAMAAFLYRLAGSPPGPFTPAGFTDVPAGSTFASEIDWLAGTGITQGRGDGTYG